LSAFEAKDYPFYAVQFHPEKNLFEWKVLADRSDSGVEIVQILSNKFVEQARNSKNTFGNDADFMKASIYNHRTQATTMSFTSIYLFNEVTLVEEKDKRERET
jgi:gamma-glutamyl hydrolase